MNPLWPEHYRAVCRRHGDLVAVLESGTGRLALVFRHTPLPLIEESEVWVREIRDLTRAVMSDLRRAGLRRRYLVLQGRPPREARTILRMWTCRYDGDPERRGAILKAIERHLEDQRFVAARQRIASPLPQELAAYLARGGQNVELRALSTWYSEMIDCWIDAEPAVRRQLILRTHQWIIDRVLASAEAHAPILAELGDAGPLARSLEELVPPHEAGRWTPWIASLLSELRRALGWPSSRRGEPWMRHLFVVPSLIPVPAIGDGVSTA